MTYRGIVSNGVVVVDGEALLDGTVVDVIPRTQLIAPALTPADEMAKGLWKDRTDLPGDSVEASKFLRSKLMRRDDD